MKKSFTNLGSAPRFPMGPTDAAKDLYKPRCVTRPGIVGEKMIYMSWRGRLFFDFFHVMFHIVLIFGCQIHDKMVS